MSGPGSNDPKPPTDAKARGLGAPKPSAAAGDTAPVVVVVDDDSDIRTMLVRALGANYTVYEAADGQQARDLLQAIGVPDAIVCDVMMPQLDGLSFAKLVRKDPGFERVPILFLTARGSPHDVISGINAGARHYVTKPFKIADVVAKVAQMTARR